MAGRDTDAAQIDVGQLEQMFEHWPHAVFALDISRRYVFQNVLDRQAFGDLVTKVADDVSDETAHAEDWAELHRRVLAGETITQLVTHDQGSEGARDAEVTMSPLIRDNQTIGILGMAVDRSESAQLQRETETAWQTAKATSARLERLTNNVPGGIFEFVIGTDGSFSFPYVSSGMAPLLGTTKDALLRDAAAGFENDHPDDADYVMDAILLSRETLEPVQITHRLIHPDLGLRWHRINASPTRRPDGTVIWHGSIFDVTEEWARAEELEAARGRMEALSFVDPLTNLPNRRACDTHLARRAAQDAVDPQRTTAIRVDLDHFKSVNDTLGHAAGDAVLCRVAGLLQELTSDGDFVARLGGDEFVVILAPGRTIMDGENLIARMRAEIGLPFTFDGRHCRFDASFGIASAEALPEDQVELLAWADAALLRAKGLGRGRTVAFTEKLQKDIVHRRMRAVQIRDALDREEFIPVFQPQINAVTGELAGFEVLARWDRPGEGELPPSEFIGVAEQMRVVQEIDRMMFEKALAVLDRLSSDALNIPKMSFNVSAARVSDPEIISSVRQMQTSGTKVAFELLESILLEEETALFAHHIELIRDFGVDIEVDDFGSGRASVIGVLKVGPDALKIDQRLIFPMFESKASMGLLRAIIDIGLSLDINVTAEGVETMDHANALREMGCHTLQGYVFGRPLREADLRDYLRSFRPVFDRENDSLKAAS